MQFIVGRTSVRREDGGRLKSTPSIGQLILLWPVNAEEIILKVEPDSADVQFLFRFSSIESVQRAMGRHKLN